VTDYAVGDIQGCLKPLQRALSQVAFNPSKDTLWIAGDLVNRGPQSLETLKLIYRLADSTRIVLGNHDLHLIATYFGVRKASSKDTFDDILLSPDAPKLIDFLLEQPLIQHDKALGYTMTHAGIPAIWSTSTAKSLAEEVSDTLRNPRERQAFLEDMYGNEPDMWSDQLTGKARLRVITNYLTRMRFISQSGRLDLAANSGPLSPPKSMKPWYEYSPLKARKTRIIFGHWAALQGLLDHPEVIGLDTGCVWGGHLTVMNLHSGEFYQNTPEERQLPADFDSD